MCLIMIHNAVGSVLLWDVLNPLFGNPVNFSDRHHLRQSRLCLSIAVKDTGGFWLRKYLPGH